MKSLIIRYKPRGHKFSYLFDIVVCYKHKNTYGSSLAKLGYFEEKNTYTFSLISIFKLDIKLFEFWVRKGAIIHPTLLKKLKIE